MSVSTEGGLTAPAQPLQKGEGRAHLADKTERLGRCRRESRVGAPHNARGRGRAAVGSCYLQSAGLPSGLRTRTVPLPRPNAPRSGRRPALWAPRLQPPEAGHLVARQQESGRGPVLPLSGGLSRGPSSLRSLSDLRPPPQGWSAHGLCRSTSLPRAVSHNTPGILFLC